MLLVKQYATQNVSASAISTDFASWDTSRELFCSTKMSAYLGELLTMMPAGFHLFITFDVIISSAERFQYAIVWFGSIDAEMILRR
jgi:hypothetical protein